MVSFRLLCVLLFIWLWWYCWFNDIVILRVIVGLGGCYDCFWFVTAVNLSLFC